MRGKWYWRGGSETQGLAVVEEVVKGVESRRFLRVPGIAAGERVVVLERYEEPREKGTRGLGVWPVVEGVEARVRVPNETGVWGGPATLMVALTEVRKEAEQRAAPEAAGLQQKLRGRIVFTGEGGRAGGKGSG